MSEGLFSAGFAWSDEPDVSQTRATPAATPDFAVSTAGNGGVSSDLREPVATVATVADDADGARVSQTRVAGDATPAATPETTDFCDVRAVPGAGVAPVASVAAWQDGVSRMRAPVPPIACVTWALVVEDARAFLRMWGDDAVKAGWTTLEVFGVNANPAARRLDTLGLVVLLQGRTVQSLDSEMALIGSGANMTVFRRSLVAPGGVALWDLPKRDDVGVGRWEGPGDTAFSGTPDLRSLSTGMGGEHENPALRKASGGRW